jgi:hypothetical protein
MHEPAQTRVGREMVMTRNLAVVWLERAYRDS